MTPTKSELPSTIRLDFDVKKILKFSRVRLLSLSKNALTRIRTNGTTTNSRRKRM